MSIDQFKENSDRVSELLKQRKVVTPEQADAIGHALVDIAESIQRIYIELIPKVLNEQESSEEVFQDAVWDLREEFRHIDYHIQDSGLIDL